MTDPIHELLHRNLREVFGEGDANRFPIVVSVARHRQSILVFLEL